MIQVQTRRNSKGNWWCNATIQGHDESFEATEMKEAQSQMIERLQKRNIDPISCNWEDPKSYTKILSKLIRVNSGIGYRKIRLDHNPIG